jgi:LPS-assembly protein
MPVSKFIAAFMRNLAVVAVPLIAALAAPAYAQSAEPVTPPNPTSDPDQVDFTADTLNYDNEGDIVTASGDVRMTREGNRVRADNVVWNRKTGEVVATGSVQVINPGGDTAYGDKVVLTDTLKDGVIDNLLIVLADGGRLAAKKGIRTNGISNLDRAVYSACSIEGEGNCPKTPSWRITAVQVTHDPVKNRVSYKNAQLELFGVPILVLPRFSHPADNKGGSGFLVPDIQYSRVNGLELSQPFYIKIDNNRDLTIKPHIYSQVLPALEAEYRALTSKGAYRIGGFTTFSNQFGATTASNLGSREFRGYLDASGRFQLDPKFSIRSSIRLATDRTFLRRYDISRDDRLRSTIAIEHVTRTSYASLTAWGFQTLRSGERQGLVPIVLPVFDLRKRIADPFVNGRFDLQLNTLAINRTQGQDTQRGFASARWDLRRITSLGQEFQLTAFARGDIYHTDEAGTTLTASYRGQDGWNGRFIGAAAAEIRWPFIGAAFGGTQRLTPRLQVVTTPGISNLKVPNEDARAVDLEDSNLFALNRFPGYDRFEDGTRVTYGVDWALDIRSFSISANVGQSYRLNNKPSLFPDGTGLTSRTSDIVGRTTLKYKRFVSLTHRYRLDKDGLRIRRNEVDATIGSDQTYVTAGYLRLNRNVISGIEDLRDREEIRLGGRIHFAKFWSVFGSTVIDLTGKQEDPTSLSDGYEPIRHRLGVAYEDDCLRFGLTWRRDYDPSGDARRGNTYQLQLSFKHLGR